MKLAISWATRSGASSGMKRFAPEFLTAAQVKEMVPIIDLRAGGRYPVLGASLQRRGGTARFLGENIHDRP